MNAFDSDERQGSVEELYARWAKEQAAIDKASRLTIIMRCGWDDGVLPLRFPVLNMDYLDLSNYRKTDIIGYIHNGLP